MNPQFGYDIHAFNLVLTISVEILNIFDCYHIIHASVREKERYDIKEEFNNSEQETCHSETYETTDKNKEK